MQYHPKPTVGEIVHMVIYYVAIIAAGIMLYAVAWAEIFLPVLKEPSELLWIVGLVGLILIWFMRWFIYHWLYTEFRWRPKWRIWVSREITYVVLWLGAACYVFNVTRGLPTVVRVLLALTLVIPIAMARPIVGDPWRKWGPIWVRPVGWMILIGLEIAMLVHVSLELLGAAAGWMILIGIIVYVLAALFTLGKLLWAIEERHARRVMRVTIIQFFPYHTGTADDRSP